MALRILTTSLEQVRGNHEPEDRHSILDISMCGIFGIAAASNSQLNGSVAQQLVKELFLLSEARGREAAGILVATTKSVNVFKRAQSAHTMLETPEYRHFIESSVTDDTVAEGIVLIGHSRLVTNGSHGIDTNNQPVRAGHSVGVHNGIIINDAQLWAEHPFLERKFNVDTEVIYRFIDHFIAQNGGDITQAIRDTYKKIRGEATIAFVTDSNNGAYLATNVGSLFHITNRDRQAIAFASEKYFLKAFAKSSQSFAVDTINQVTPGTGVKIQIEPWEIENFGLFDNRMTSGNLSRTSARPIREHTSEPRQLVRCTKCILPHTFPLISFDKAGVCNFCRDAQEQAIRKEEPLEQQLAPFRRPDGSPDCIVALSGGRDSCYGLHVLKNDLGMNPIAYTYDWAMVTDEARRNCSRMCSALGIEHIIRSADIKIKRRNIKLNVEAWLHRPALGMIPLFMAGDKQFFHYANQVSKETKIPLVIFCGGNDLEITRFKSGFCGVKDKSEGTMVGLSHLGKLPLFAYYTKQVLRNPRYLNRSLWDTLFAFYSTYIERRNFLYLYRHLEWDESKINSTLKDIYGWESAEKVETTWRIGDGTASFYNYIYHTVAGFSEHDTFRSNQIRAGLISRERALQLVESENLPRYDGMEEYARLVGFSLEDALVTINNIPKLK